MSVVLPLDLTGRAASNKVTDEVKTLLPADKRVLVLEHGPFYTKGLVVNRNDAQETLMVPGVDYQAVQLFPELTLRTGLEVCSAIIILRSSGEVGDSFKITAQMVGGDYSASAQGLQAMLDAADIDNSSVEWGQIYGRPAQYPAAHHLQDIEDAYGFEYVVNELESIRQAVEQGDASSREELSAYISGRFTALQQELAQMGSWTVSGDLNWGSARDERSGLTIQWGRSGLLTVGSSQIMHYHRVFTSRFYTMPVMEGKSVAVEGDWDLYAPFHTVVIGDQQSAVLPVGVTMPDDRHACFLALGRVKSSSGNQSYVGYVAMGLTDEGLNTSAPTGGSGAVVAQSYFAPSLVISPTTSNRNDTVETTSGAYASAYFTPSVNGGSGAYTYTWTLSNATGGVTLDRSGNTARLVLPYAGLAAEGETRSGSGTLTCSVSDNITGLTDTRSVTSSLQITYHIPYAPVSVTISPSPLYNTAVSTTVDGTVYSDWVTASVSGGGGGITGNWTLVSSNPGSHTTNVGIETNGNKARLWLNYAGLTTDGAQTDAGAILRYAASDSVSGFNGSADVNIVLTAQRSIVYPTLTMTVTPGGTSKDQTVTTSAGTLYSEWFTQAASGGSGNYNTVVWALENAVGGVTIETQVVGGQPQARMVFAFSGLTTDGAMATGSGRLRATVTDSVTGLSASAYGDYSFKATRSLVYPDLSISMSPTSLTSNITVESNEGIIYGGITTATVTGGSGGYSYSWQIQGTGGNAITADPTISGTSNQLRGLMGYTGLTTDGAYAQGTATAVLTVTDSVAGKTATANVPISMRATRSLVYPALGISMSGGNVSNDVTVDSASGTVYSDWISSSGTGGSGSYAGSISVLSGSAGVSLDGGGVNGHIRFDYSGLVNNGSSATGTATLRYTITDTVTGQSVYADRNFSIKATRLTNYTQLGVSLTPTSSTATTDAATSASSAYGNFVTPVISGGSGSYSVQWSISGNGSLSLSGNTARAAVNYDPNNLAVGANNFSGTLTCTVTDAMAGMSANASVPFSININKAPPNSGTLTADSLSWHGDAIGGNGASGFTLNFNSDGTFYYEGRVGSIVSSSKTGTWLTSGSASSFEIYLNEPDGTTLVNEGSQITSENSNSGNFNAWVNFPQSVGVGPGGYSAATSYDFSLSGEIRDKNNHANTISFTISGNGSENCFAVGTLVRTEAGDLPIQTLAVNTELESFTCDNMLDEDDPDWESWTSENPNIQQTSTFVRNIGVFKAQGGFVVNEFICTGGHVWFILRDSVYRWCRTRDLLLTDQLVSDDGPVDITAYFETAAEIQFVSMNVEDVDTYKVVDTHGRAYYTHNAYS